MRLYVWHEVLSDYTHGVIFALASSAEEARRVVIAQVKEDWQRVSIERAITNDPAVYDSPVGFFVFGGG